VRVACHIKDSEGNRKVGDSNPSQAIEGKKDKTKKSATKLERRFLHFCFDLFLISFSSSFFSQSNKHLLRN